MFAVADAFCFLDLFWVAVNHDCGGVGLCCLCKVQAPRITEFKTDLSELLRSSAQKLDLVVKGDFVIMFYEMLGRILSFEYLCTLW